MSPISGYEFVLVCALFAMCFIAWRVEAAYRNRNNRKRPKAWFGLLPLEFLFIFYCVTKLSAYVGEKYGEPYPGAMHEQAEVNRAAAEEMYEASLYGGRNQLAAPAQVATATGTASVVTLPGSGTVSIATGDLADGGTTAGRGLNLPEAGQSSGPQRLTANQYAAGFALVTQTVSDMSSWLAMPSNAVVHYAWACYGAARDSFWLPATNWDFVLGTNAVEGALVSSSGTLSFWRPKGSPSAVEMPDGTGISFLAPLQGRFGIVPPGGRFWHAVTDSNSVLFTWQDVFAGRDTNSPVSFQAELFWNGDFTYRYAFPSNSSILNPNSSFTNFVIGAQHNGGGETYALNDTNLLFNGLELRWRAFGMLDPNLDDFDGDGLSDYDEVMKYGTDPRLPDSDFDGLSDSAEIALRTDPLNPDTDRDGLADGIDPQPLVWNDPDATNAFDGLTYWYKIQHGLDPAADNSLDTDHDGWPDWKERLAGTLTNNNSSVPVTYETVDSTVPALFDVTITLNADLPCAAVLTVGSHTLALMRAGSYRLTLMEGEAHSVTLRASRPCTVSLTANIGSPYAALQNPGGVFTGGAAVPGGAAVACGMIAQPLVSIGPDRVCFHASHPKTVVADVTPPMDGTYHWWWYGGQISATGGKSANISWGGGDNWVSMQFTAAGASMRRIARKDVTRCSRVDEDTWCDRHDCEHWYCACDEQTPDVEAWCGFHGRKVSECLAQYCPTHHCHYSECPANWCHEHACLYTVCYDRHYHPDDHGDDPSGSGGSGGPGSGEPPATTPVTPPDDDMATSGWIRLNDDDGNKDGSDDRFDALPAADSDLRPIWPLGSFSGVCCPCPEHRGAGGWQAKLISCTEGLKVYRDNAKLDSVSIGNTFLPGDCVYVEGYAASAEVGSESLGWEISNTGDANSETYELDNAFSVLSLRLTGDYNFDGAVDGADRIVEPGLSETYGWGIPVASNSFKRVGLSTQCRLNGVFTLSLNGTAGAVRIWATGSPGSGDTPLLVCGQTVTNGVNGADFAEYGDTVLFIEALSNTTATLTYRYRGTGTAAGIAFETSLKMTTWDVGIAMDGDRDGVISFTGTNDTSYVFWVNDDHDAIENGEEDDKESGPADCADSVITCMRDLEDFARLHVKIGADVSCLNGVTYSLKFENVTGTPMVNVFEAVDETADYLSDTNAATLQIQKQSLTPNGVYTTEISLDGLYVKTGGEVSPFIIEGSAPGTGDLTLIVKKDGTEICRKAVSLELHPIKWFYDIFKTEIVTGSDSNQWTVQVQNYTRYNTAQYPAEKDDYLLYVHGWNMAEWEKERWAETAFKRLWWQGYKGKLGLFSWPTLYGFDLQNVLWNTHHFDTSEYRSWLCADNLVSCFNELNENGKLRVLAHSMGNVVAGEALRKYTGTPLYCYIASQAAISANSYDISTTIPEIQRWFYLPAPIHYGDSTPNIIGHYHSGEVTNYPHFTVDTQKASTWHNYYNSEDYALSDYHWELDAVSRPDNWTPLFFNYTGRINQYDETQDHFYRWLGDDPNGNPIHDNLSVSVEWQRYEIFAYCEQSRVRALGAVENVSNFQDYDLRSSPLNYNATHYSHSREFRSNIIDEKEYWKQVSKDCAFSQ